MASPIEIRTFQQILGRAVAKFKAETNATDLFPGSVSLTILEAASGNDFAIEAKALKLINVNDVDKQSGQQLKDLAITIGLEPPPIGAEPSTVQLTITETAYSKISSTVYSGLNNPLAGDTVLNVVDASKFSASGTIYIGRNTPQYETASYVSKTNTGSGYWTLSLSAPLAKDHLVNEEVVMGQTGDRTIQAGTTARVPSGAGAAQISFSIVNTWVLPDGETTLSGVTATCTTPGSVGQVGSGRVSEFQSPPWSTASVSNPDPAVGGIDAETDEQLRQRIKDWPNVIATGNDTAIERAVIGLTDSSESKRVVSAYLLPPTQPGKYAVLFIDDGNGLQPSFSGVGSETVVSSGNGATSRFQLQNDSLVKAQLASAATEPFALFGGENLAFTVDNVTEQQVLPASSFKSLGAATAQEIAQAINLAFKSVEARAKNGQLFCFPTTDDPDYIQVATPTGTDANAIIALPTTKEYTLRLYQDGKLLSKNGVPAIVTSNPQSLWTGLTSSETLLLSVDGITPGAATTIADADFVTNSNSTTLVGASPNDWVGVINAKFIGVTASANADGSFSIQSNRGRSSKAQVVISGGTLATKLFGSTTNSTGTDPQYTLNRFTGLIELSQNVPSGSSLMAGTANTQGSVTGTAIESYSLPATTVSTTGTTVSGNNQITSLASTVGVYQGMAISGTGIAAGSFVISISGTTVTMNQNATASGSGVALTFTLSPQMVLVNHPVTTIPLNQFVTLTFTAGSNIQTIQSSASGYFASVNANDWIHLFNLPRNSLLKVYRVYQTTNPNDTIDCFDPNPQAGSATLDNTTRLFSCFRTAGRPQLVSLISGSNITAAQVASSINSQTQSIVASATSKGAVSIATARFASSGALGVPVIAIPALGALGITPGSYASNDPQVASIESGDLAGLPKDAIQIQTADLSEPWNTFQASGTPFGSNLYADRALLGYFGSSETSFRMPQSLDSTSQLTMRGDVPAPWVELGGQSRFCTTDGIELGEADDVTLMVDQNATQKSFDVPLYLSATIANPAVPTTTQWDAQDASGNLLGTSSKWAGHRFEDYRVWFQARADVTNPAANSSVRITSNKFGPNGQKVRFGYFYPTAAGQSNSTTISVDTTNDFINVQNFLASGSQASVGLAANQKVYIDVSGSGPYTYKVQFSSPVNLGSIDTTYVVYPAGSEFNAANVYPIRVVTVSNLSDSGKTFSSSGSTITISANPSFTIAIGDVIQSGGYTMRITAVSSQTSVTVDTTPNPVLSGAIGTISRIYLLGTRQVNGVTESQTVTSSNDVLVYPLSFQTASAVISAINQNAQALAVISASLTPSNDGTGQITKSTEDQLANGSLYAALQNGESYVKSTNAASPGITLKVASDFVPSVGDPIRLIPATVQNLYDHLNKKPITGLTVAANLAIVGHGRKLQVSTQTVGGAGQIYATGGRASGNIPGTVYNQPSVAGSTRATVEVDSAYLTQLSPNQTIKLYQAGLGQKSWTGSAPGNTDTIALAVSGTTVTATLTQNFATLYTWTYAQNTVWLIRPLSRNRVRYEIYSGASTLPASLKENDWVFVGDGVTAYAGLTPTGCFLPANQGWFQIRKTDNSKYFDVENPNGAAELTQDTSVTAPFAFCSYHSTRPGDTVQLGTGVPIGSNNQGSFKVLSVPTTTTLTYTNAQATAVSAIALGGSGVSTLKILDQGYTTYRQVILVSPKPTDPSNKAIVMVSPGTDLNLLNQSLGAKILPQNRLNFPTNPVNGKNGYQYWIGLKRAAQRVVNGYEPEGTDGQQSSGAFIEARESQIQRIVLAFRIATNEGVNLGSISNDLKSRIIGYVNNRGLGQAIVMSEIISLLQDAPGVHSVLPTGQYANVAEIPVNSNAQPKTSAFEITLS